jgi:hypothetical protein
LQESDLQESGQEEIGSVRAMKAAFLPGNSTVEMKTIPVPEPAHREVLIAVKASTICGSDIRAIYPVHLATSFFMSLMFPTISALGIEDLGVHTKEGSSLIVTAIIGGAVFTPFMGLVFEVTRSMALSMSVPLACYLVVAGCAFWGSQLVSPRELSVVLSKEVQGD